MIPLSLEWSAIRLTNLLLNDKEPDLHFVIELFFAGMGLLADRYTDDAERGTAMGIALGGLVLGMTGDSIEPLIYIVHKYYQLSTFRCPRYFTKTHTRKGAGLQMYLGLWTR